AAPESSPSVRRRARPMLRIAGLALLVVVGWSLLFATGAIDAFEEDRVRALVNGAGAYGIAVFVLAFVGAQLLHIPGSFLIAVAGAAWGWALGGAIAWAASVIA